MKNAASPAAVLRPAESPGVFDSQHRVDALWAVVLELPEHLKEIIVLHVFEKMTLKDLATLKGIPISTLHSRYKAALKILQKKVIQSGEFVEDE